MHFQATCFLNRFLCSLVACRPAPFVIIVIRCRKVGDKPTHSETHRGHFCWNGEGRGENNPNGSRFPCYVFCIATSTMKLSQDCKRSRLWPDTDIYGVRTASKKTKVEMKFIRLLAYLQKSLLTPFNSQSMWGIPNPRMGNSILPSSERVCLFKTPVQKGPFLKGPL